MHLHHAMRNTGHDDTNTQGILSKGLLLFPRTKKKILDSLNNHSAAREATKVKGGLLTIVAGEDFHAGGDLRRCKVQAA